MKCIVDTNVAIVANQRDDAPASLDCVLRCIALLDEFQHDQRQLVIDDYWHILSEYQRNLCSTGQPGVGDAFLLWVLTNRANPRRCEQVHITPRDTHEDHWDFDEFPNTPDLQGFDRSDRKFAAVARAHPEHPPVVNATDSDWWDYRDALAAHDVRVEFVCPDAQFMPRQ